MTIGWDSQGYPICPCDQTMTSYWCSHIKEHIVNGHDSLNEDFVGGTVMVPVFPTHQAWVEVQISDDRIGDAASMTMHYTPDFGPVKVIPLGFWNLGEGRYSIRSVILDYLKAQIDPRDDNNSPVIKYTPCPAGLVHNWGNQKKINTNRSINWKWYCLWNIIMEKACTPCRQDSSGSDDSLDGVEAEPPPWAAGRRR